MRHRHTHPRFHLAVLPSVRPSAYPSVKPSAIPPFVRQFCDARHHFVRKDCRRRRNRCPGGPIRTYLLRKDPTAATIVTHLHRAVPKGCRRRRISCPGGPITTYLLRKNPTAATIVTHRRHHRLQNRRPVPSRQ